MSSLLLGLDLGTSGVKAVLLDGLRVVCGADAPLALSRPHPGWSEQAPGDWWTACESAVRRLREQAGPRWSGVAAIGLSGQMHGAVVLGADEQPLRPAILWNDSRSASECEALERAVPAQSRITGNLAMPGFTAPKLLWLRQHEPQVFAAVRRVLLPKDWLRLQLCGEAVSDCSDAAGTLWLDVAQRRWSPELLAGCGLSVDHMPALVEGSAISGQLRDTVAQDWGLRAGIPIAGGGGDNAASAIGLGCLRADQGFVSLGTSGVVFVANDRFSPNPSQAVHAFCHALPQRWHQMAVTLSAAACLQWLQSITGRGSSELATAAAAIDRQRAARAPLFLPYLAGERTPHNNADAAGAFLGLRSEHEPADLAHAVMEGVAFSLADGADALSRAGARLDAGLSLVGGGSRSAHWAGLLASSLGVPMLARESGDITAAIGAARLAGLACGAFAESDLQPPPLLSRHEADPAWTDTLRPRLARFRAAYPALERLRTGAPT